MNAALKTLSFLIGIRLLALAMPANAQGTLLPEQSDRKINAPTVSLSDTTSLAVADSLIKNDFSEPIFYESEDSLYFAVSERKARMYNKAKLKNGNIELESNFIRIDMSTNELYAFGLPDSIGKVIGRPIFQEGGQKFQADTLRYNMHSKQGIVKNVRTEQAGGYLHGGVTKIHSNRHIHIRDGKYTTCDAEHPHFYINMSKAKVVDNKKIITGPVNFVILDIPTPIGLPFGYFPSNAKKQSGFLTPKYGEDRSKGFFLRDGGFYWALSDYADLALVGGVYTKGSWEAKLSSNYKLRYKFSGNVNLFYASNVIGEEGLPGYKKQTTYKIGISHNQDSKANPYSRFTVSVNYEGGGYRQYNSTSVRDYVNTINSSSISYSLTPNQNWNLNLSANATQNTQTHLVNMTAPNASFNVNRRYLFGNDKTGGKRKWYEKIQYSYTASAKATINGNDSTLLTDATRVEAGFTHSIPVSASYKFWKYFTLSPSVNYKGVLYPNYIRKTWYPKVVANGEILKDTTVTDTISQVRYAHSISPTVSLGFAPKVFGFFEFAEWTGIKAIRHLMTPSISMNLSPDARKWSPGYYASYTSIENGEEVENSYSIFANGMYGTPQGNDQAGSISFQIGNQLEMKMRNKLKPELDELTDTTTTEKKDKPKDKKITLIENLNIGTSYNMFADRFNWSDVRLSGKTSLFNRQLSINFGATYTMYAHDTQGRAVNDFRWNQGMSPLRLTRANLALSGKLDNKVFRAKTNRNPIILPWSLNLSYAYNLNAVWNSTLSKFENKNTQTLNFSGNISLTDNFKFTLQSGLDISKRKLTMTTINITRDLHCWQMSLNWIPFGTLRSYYFTINVKSSIFEGIKYSMRESRSYTTF